MKAIFHPKESGRIHIQVLRAIYFTERRWRTGGIVKTYEGRTEKNLQFAKNVLLSIGDTLFHSYFPDIKQNTCYCFCVLPLIRSCSLTKECICAERIMRRRNTYTCMFFLKMHHFRVEVQNVKCRAAVVWASQKWTWLKKRYHKPYVCILALISQSTSVMYVQSQ